MRHLKANKEFNNYVLSLNKFDQLYDEGIDIRGKKLKSDFAPLGQVYATSTIVGTTEFKGKEQKGQPTDRITLFDKGVFYKSFKIELTSNFDLRIVANDVNKLEDTFGKVIGLTSENYKKAIDKAQEILREYVNQKLLSIKLAA